VHLTGTLTASAPHQRRRGRTGPGLVLEGSDLREHRREGRESNLVLFVVDASGSMAARRRMEAVKGAVLSLLLDAYQRRDKVGLVCFRGAGAELLLPPTSSVDAAARRLETLQAPRRRPTGVHPDFPGPSQTPPDTRAALNYGNRTQYDTVRRNPAAWHAEGQGLESATGWYPG
jgi:hypothetical protein